MKEYKVVYQLGSERPKTTYMSTSNPLNKSDIIKDAILQIMRIENVERSIVHICELTEISNVPPKIG